MTLAAKTRETQVFVDALREALGLAPLYAPDVAATAVQSREWLIVDDPHDADNRDGRWGGGATFRGMRGMQARAGRAVR